ncbi:MAG: TIGR03085 family metal-binding protein [Acidimicrobiales bacterium]
MSHYAQQERRSLCELFLRVGPDAPTLCDGWTTADLAAHLVVRERRPDAAPGIVVPALSGYTERVQRHVRDGRSWEDLVDTVRRGPPFPLRLAVVDEPMNTAEYFVHHEDVRRAGTDTAPRHLDPALEHMLWSRVRLMARAARRAVPCGLRLVAPGFTPAVVRASVPEVTAAGRPGELLLFLFGRQVVADVELSGEDDAVEQVRRAKLGF